MQLPDARGFGEALVSGLFFATASLEPHPDDLSVSTPGWLNRRAATTASSTLCAASLPTSCALLDSKSLVVLLGTIPMVCLADIKSLSTSLWTSISTDCALDFAATGSTLLACMKSELAAKPVSTSCAKTATSSSASASATAAATSAKSSSASASATSNTVTSTVASVMAVASESIVAVSQDYVRQGAAPVEQTTVNVNGAVISTNTSIATNATTITNVTTLATTSSSTILIFARDTASSYSAYSGLNGYGIPFQVVVVPQTGITLPSLNDTANYGNFGGIVILSEVSYDYGTAGGGFQSALTPAQWLALNTYQLAFGVRMVRLDVFPSTDTGTTAQGGCCAAGDEQLISISNNKQFLTAGLNVGATLSTLGLYHYPATITNATLATEFLQFGTSAEYTTTSTAGVINNIAGREQMVFFISFATDWSPTSNFLQHAWIHWITRGLYVGYRRVNLGTQIDDMFLESDIYYPGNGTTFRIRTGDLDAIKAWIPTINAKMNPGSSYFMEIGHNGNGNIEQASINDTTGKICSGGPIEYDDQVDTPLEFQKVLGTGTNIWPSKPATYPYSVACTNMDPLKVWWTTTANRDVFAHISHTFTHEGEDNATFFDINNEISWNIAWLAQTGIASAAHFSPKGLIPPAITGLHNGDALSAWSKNGITTCVGDNTRPVLMNTNNEHWPLITTMAGNGFDGMQVTPRWATNVYYNCDSTICTVQEWINTSAGSGDITALLNLERITNSRHLLGLHHDPFMFHQANLRQTDVTKTVVNGQSVQMALIQMWVETVVVEMVRLVNWPMITLKHDDIGASFASRMARDNCNPKMTFQLNLVAKTITGVTVTTTGNTCSALIPVTVPGTVTNKQGFTTEQVGNDPLTIWVKMAGSPISFTLSTPIAW